MAFTVYRIPAPYALQRMGPPQEYMPMLTSEAAGLLIAAGSLLGLTVGVLFGFVWGIMSERKRKE